MGKFSLTEIQTCHDSTTSKLQILLKFLCILKPHIHVYILEERLKGTQQPLVT